MKLLPIACLAAGLSLAAALSASAEDTPKKITIATEGAYAPWNFTTADGKPDGMEVELARNLCERMKVECTIITQDWDGLIPALTVGKFDVIMASMFITDKRLEVIDFTQPYAIDPSGFAVAKDSPLGALAGSTREDKTGRRGPCQGGNRQDQATNRRQDRRRPGRDGEPGVPEKVFRRHRRDPRVQNHGAARPRSRGRPCGCSVCTADRFGGNIG